ncbi:MAG: OB-fold nucleic acid binding domain-containing protein [Candidatus Nanohaloarchaea archaeon]
MVSEQVVKKVLDETDLDEDELEEKVEEKMDEFSGLVSEEGALHLVAKEEGVELAEAGDNDLEIDNIVPEMRNVNLKARITNILDANTFDRDDGSEGKVQNIVLADGSGSIRVTLWDEQTQIAEKVEEGDAIEVQNAYTVEDDRGNAELRLGDESQVKMADDDEVPEIDSSSSSGGETQDASIREVRSENASYRVRGLLVNIYTSNPFYNRCPECGTSIREDDDGNMICEDHGEIEEPDKALAVSGVIDDGTGNIRVVFFRDLAREMLGVDEEVEEEGDIEAVEDAAADAVGKELVIEGRTRYNDYFGRLEMIANDMGEVDAEQEIENLMETMEA